MTNVNFSRKEFEKHIKIDDKVLEKISLFGTPLESYDNNNIEIEIFPNRPDLIPFRGFIRGFKAFLGIDAGFKKYKIKKSSKEILVKIEKEVDDIRPYTVCAIIKSLSLDDDKIKEIIDMQEKLHITLGRNREKVAIGIYPLDKINFPVTYTAKSPASIKFRPLESQKVLNAMQILEKNPVGKKYSHLLKGKKKYPVFIDSGGNILSMPPIINSEDIGRVTTSTKDVFIECSGNDENALNKTLNIIVTSLAEMGGNIFSVDIKGKKIISTPNLEEGRMKVSVDNANKLLGLNLKEKDLDKLLPKMGYKYKKGTAKIPSWRTDILHEVDIIEDIAIAYGYDNISPEIPNISTIAEESKKSIVKEKITESLIGLGLVEISTYHLIKAEEAKRSRSIELESSKTEYKFLRNNLIIPSLRVLSENIDSDYPQKIFEIGRVFMKDGSKDTGINEEDNLVIAITPGNFTEAKQHLDCLFRSLGLKYMIEESSIEDFIEGRTGDIILEGKKIGYIGEMHPKTLNSWKLKMPLSVIEISLERIYDLI